MEQKRKIRIRPSEDDVVYGEFYIPIKLVRLAVKAKYEELVFSYRLRSSAVFNKLTGEISYNYAWDSILSILQGQGKLDGILKKLIKDINDD